MEILNNVLIILIRPYISGNVGQVARILRNFGLKNLLLVNPKNLDYDEVNWFSAGSKEVLNRMKITEDLNEAIGDCHRVICTTCRKRRYDFPKKSPRDMGRDVVESLGRGERVAILFGTENSGLSNREIALCDYLVTIPTAEFSSMNLSHAVGIISYEIFTASTTVIENQDISIDPNSLPPTKEKINTLITEIIEVLKLTGFLRRRTALQAKIVLNQILSDTNLTSIRTDILLGIVRKVRYCLLNHDKVEENILFPSRFDMSL